jgi:ferrous iron transport protein A
VLGDRLVELGFTAGAPIRVLRKAPFGGPLQVQIRDFVLSLRRDDASCIHVAAGLA